MFGSPQNYDNSPTEHGLIEMAERCTDHAQKSRSLFVSQVTKHMLIKKAHQSLLHSHMLQNTEKMNNDFSNLPNSAAFCIIFDENGVCVPMWLGKEIYKENVLSMKLL